MHDPLVEFLWAILAVAGCLAGMFFLTWDSDRNPFLRGFWSNKPDLGG